MRIILTKIDDVTFVNDNKVDWDYKYNVLLSQVKELANINYDVKLIYGYE